MALVFDFAKQFYLTHLQSMHGETITWIDGDGVETSIKAMVFRAGVGSTPAPKHGKLTPSKHRDFSIAIANSDIYGKTSIYKNSKKAKVKFKKNYNDASEHLFLITHIISSDKAKLVLRCQP